MTHYAYELAVVLYLSAALVGWFSRPEERWTRPVSWLLGLGATLQTLGFVGLHQQKPPVPLESFPAALALIAWLTVVAYLFSLGIARFRGMGMWVGAIAGVITLGAELGLRLRSPTPPLPDDGGAWSHAHVLLSGGGFSMLALASLAGIAYLAKERDLKRKRGPRFALPSLEGLDRVEHVALSLGFPLLTLGMVTGFVWGADRGLSPWTGHSVWLLCAWLVYLVPITLRVFRNQHGPAPARSVVLGFAFLAFSYIGVRLLGNGA
jgi:ABC-type transport system involved in cytochrome c biogenesis permease subunit